MKVTLLQGMILVVLSPTLSSNRCGKSDSGRGPLSRQILKPGFDIGRVNPMSKWCWPVLRAIVSKILNMIPCTPVQGLSYLESTHFKLLSIIYLSHALKIKWSVFSRATSEICKVLARGVRGNEQRCENTEQGDSGRSMSRNLTIPKGN